MHDTIDNDNALNVYTNCTSFMWNYLNFNNHPNIERDETIHY